MKLSLPDVTLVMVETLEHRLAKLAVEDCLRHADFGEVLIFSDQFDDLHIPGARHLRIENWPSKIDWCRFLWHGLPGAVKTPQSLLIQWDSWIIDPSMWRDEFLRFDYIGAPWWHPTLNVGNSGFSLRSKRLMDHLVEHKTRYPVVTDGEDALLSRAYRPQLEREGFVWADCDSALDFAFEWVRASRDSKHFGFHSLMNWPFVLDADRLEERMSLVRQSKYICQRYEMLSAIASFQSSSFPWGKPNWRDNGLYHGLKREA